MRELDDYLFDNGVELHTNDYDALISYLKNFTHDAEELECEIMCAVNSILEKME